MTDPVKKRIQELGPEGKPDPLYHEETPITLATVLLAMPLELELRHEPDHIWFRKKQERKPEDDLMMFGIWNLLKDNYDEQSQETKDFIGSLLGIEGWN